METQLSHKYSVIWIESNHCLNDIQIKDRLNADMEGLRFQRVQQGVKWRPKYVILAFYG